MRRVHLAKINNLPKHHGAGPQRHEAQCRCIGLTPALLQCARTQTATSCVTRFARFFS